MPAGTLTRSRRRKASRRDTIHFPMLEVVLDPHHRRLGKRSRTSDRGLVAELVFPVLVFQTGLQAVLRQAHGAAEVVHQRDVEMGFGRGVGADFILALRCDDQAVAFEGQRQRSNRKTEVHRECGMGLVRIATLDAGNRWEGAARRIALLQDQDAGIEAPRHVPRQHRAGHQHALPGVVADVVLGVDVEAELQAERLEGTELHVLAAQGAEVDRVAVDQVGFLRARRLRQRSRVLLVRHEEIEIEEIGAEAVAAHVCQGDDVLADVLVVERLGELGAVAVADRRVAEGGGVGACCERSHRQ